MKPAPPLADLLGSVDDMGMATKNEALEAEMISSMGKKAAKEKSEKTERESKGAKDFQEWIAYTF